MNRRRLLGLSSALLAAPVVPAHAQSGPWPTRQTIRLVATFPPGGLADTIDGGDGADTCSAETTLACE